MSLKHAILGILQLRPHTGYDLKKTIESSVAHFWSADQSQIYRTLALLVSDGLAEVEVVPKEGRPDRRVHRITPLGEAELRDWLSAPSSTEAPHDTFLMRVFFVGDLGAPAAAGLIGSRRTQAQTALTRLTTLAEQERGGPVDLAHALRRATLRNGILHAEAELAWLDELAWLNDQAREPTTPDEPARLHEPARLNSGAAATAGEVDARQARS